MKPSKLIPDRHAPDDSCRTLLIATTNAGKFREFAELLGDLSIAVKSLAQFANVPEIAEEGTTYMANALHKALAVARWSGCSALADDSGLEVDALQGAPGVHSARYAGPAQDSAANIAKLLAALQGVPFAQRTARFRCVIAVARPDGATLTAEGTCAGYIIEAVRGGAGFGYDPVFLYPPLNQTFAEIPAAVKNRLSHRARACECLRPQLLAFVQP
ncbi:MAG TPA: XTP/dITP diphosphatase [Candidatus Margulisiibacteriota bacterium]|nr:XTP/dITP diphosphatase [Candidatus Margulisiibacteriota bacterium]